MATKRLNHAVGWSGFQLAGSDPRMLTVRGRQVLKKLTDLGIQIPASNRLERAITLVEKVNAGLVKIGPPGVDLERIVEADRTLYESFVIVWTAMERKRRVNPFPIVKLKYLLEGADLPSEDANSKARDTQFELMVAAQLVLGGAEITPAEPDYRLLFLEDHVGVAVKRLSSIKRTALRRALRGAAGQIRSSTGRGFVAVNLDSWVADLPSNAIEDFGHLDAKLRSAYRELGRASERRSLIGALVFGRFSGWRHDHEPPAKVSVNFCHHVMFSDPANNGEKAKEFFDAWHARLEAGLKEINAKLQPP
jgi:hypothetical protein